MSALRKEAADLEIWCRTRRRRQRLSKRGDWGGSCMSCQILSSGRTWSPPNKRSAVCRHARCFNPTWTQPTRLVFSSLLLVQTPPHPTLNLPHPPTSEQYLLPPAAPTFPAPSTSVLRTAPGWQRWGLRKLIAFLSVLKQGLEVVSQCRITPTQGAESPEDFYRQVHSHESGVIASAPPSQSDWRRHHPLTCPGPHISIWPSHFLYCTV